MGHHQSAYTAKEDKILTKSKVRVNDQTGATAAEKETLLDQRRPQREEELMGSATSFKTQVHSRISPLSKLSNSPQQDCRQKGTKYTPKLRLKSNDHLKQEIYLQH